LWGVGKPVVNPAGWFSFPAAAEPRRSGFSFCFFFFWG